MSDTTPEISSLNVRLKTCFYVLLVILQLVRAVSTLINCMTFTVLYLCEWMKSWRDLT